MSISIEDRLAIQDLYARYNHAVDLGDPDGWAACFTSDASFHTEVTGTLRGREALAAFARTLNAQMTTRHWTNNLLLEATDGGARGKCYLILLRLPGGSPATIAMTGIYTDELTREDGEWLFSSRTAVFDS